MKYVLGFARPGEKPFHVVEQDTPPPPLAMGQMISVPEGGEGWLNVVRVATEVLPDRYVTTAVVSPNSQANLGGIDGAMPASWPWQ